MLIAIVIGHVLLVLATNYVVPIFDAPDEDSHFRFVRLLAQGKGLPNERVPNQSAFAESFNPPLAYVLPAIVLRLVDPNVGSLIDAEINSPDVYRAADGLAKLPSRNAKFLDFPDPAGRHGFFHPAAGPLADQSLRAVHWVRLTSLLCSLITLAQCWRIVRVLVPDRPALWLVGLALLAFNPQFIFLSSVINSDNWVTAMSSIVIAELVTRGPAPWSIRSSVWFGLLMGVGFLCKPNILFLFAPVVVVAWYRSSSWQKWFVAMLVLAGVFGVIAGWFFVRNVMLYGIDDPLGWRTRAELHPSFVLKPDERWSFLLTRFPKMLFASFWGMFGQNRIALSTWQLVIYAGISLLVPIALLPSMSRERRFAWLLG